MQRGHLLVLATALISGVSIFLNKFGVAGFNPFVYTGAKNVVVAVMLFSAIALLGQWKRLKALSMRQWRSLAVIGVVGGSVPFLIYFYALKSTSAVAASFIHKTMFIYIAVIAFVALRERLGRRQVAATLGLLCGTALLVGIPSQLDTGAALIALATFFWACETVISKRILRDVAPLPVAFGRMFFGSLIIFAFLFVTGDIALMTVFTADQLPWVALSSVLLFGYVVTWYHGLARIQASEAAALLTVGAVVTPLLGLGASLSLENWLGVLLILACTAPIVAGSASAGNAAARGMAGRAQHDVNG